MVPYYTSLGHWNIIILEKDVWNKCRRTVKFSSFSDHWGTIVFCWYLIWPRLYSEYLWYWFQFYLLGIALSFGTSMACFLGSKDLYKKCLLYDDLMANTEKETTELFEALGQIFLWNWLDHLALYTQLYKPCYEAFQMFWRHVLKTKHLGNLILWLIRVETRSMGRMIRLPVNFIENVP